MGTQKWFLQDTAHEVRCGTVVTRSNVRHNRHLARSTVESAAWCVNNMGKHICAPSRVQPMRQSATIHASICCDSHQACKDFGVARKRKKSSRCGVVVPLGAGQFPKTRAREVRPICLSIAVLESSFKEDQDILPAVAVEALHRFRELSHEGAR
jgi:hypothetical protein